MAYRETGTPRRVVVDASIARAAGESQQSHSKCGREVLTAILEISHIAHFTEQLLTEWKDHRSRFSSTWLASMKARKKYIREEVARDEELRERVAASIGTEERRQAIEKDMHLVEAAFATDRIVISYDDRARAALAEAVTHYNRIRLLAWINPVSDNEICQWLEDGADCVHKAIWP